MEWKTFDRRLPDAVTTSPPDRVYAGGVALLAFGVYLATLYPGLTLIGDATKFALVGKILGTPHQPGYPLYVWTSHLFSYLPFGTLAYRMNVLAALWASLAVALCYLVVRHLGVRRSLAAPVALALAFGNAFWSRALYAKGTYVLSAVLILGGVLALLRWSETGTRRYLLIAIAVFSLSLGNHLTVLALLPALVTFVLVTNPRQAVEPATIVTALVAPILGFAQYLLIIVRTLQGAPYLEARATNLHELWAVMTAKRFAQEVGAYTWTALMSTRVPIITGLIDTELRFLGLTAIAFGFVVLARERWRLALLFGLGALGVTLLTTNMSSDEDQGFLVAVFALVWPVAAVGLERAAALFGRAMPRLGPAFVFLLAIAIPIGQLQANYRRNDHHRETFETLYFDTLFDALPTNTAIVDDEYRFNVIVYYKLYGEDIARTKRIVIAPVQPAKIRALQESGFNVIAFNDGRSGLERFGARFEPYELPVSPAAKEILHRRGIYQLEWLPVCMDVAGQGWRDLGPALARGALSVHIDNYRDYDASVVTYSLSTRAISPVAFAERGIGTPRMTFESYALADPAARQRLDARARADAASLWPDMAGATHVTRTEVRINDRGQNAQFALDFGAATRALLGQIRVDADGATRGRVCSHALTRADSWPVDEPRAAFATDSSKIEFGSGWSNPERRSDGVTYRWTSDHAVVVAAIERPRTAIVRVEAEPFNYPGRRSSIAITVNGHKHAPKPLPDERTFFEWIVPAEEWREGLNQVVLDVDGAKRPIDFMLSNDKRLLGASVRQIEFIDAAAAPR